MATSALRREPIEMAVTGPVLRLESATAAGWRRAVLLAAAVALFLLALTPATTLWDRDEPRFAGAAADMLASGRYLAPTFNGELRAQKPILIYWLMTLSLRAIGRTELAVRFWSP